MAKLIECVPNFSEGRRPEVIDAICDAITSVEGVTLLDREMDSDHNRAVVTFVSHPDVAVEAAFRGYAEAAKRIDMTTHTGEHPRMGACDVCPFIPLSELSMEDAVELATKLGRRVGDELAIPVYLYEEAATSPKRKNLANVRQGEYEGIRDSIETDPARRPDFGPARMNLRSGSTAIGARFPLVAFNVYLNTNEKWIADKLADAVRHLRGGFRYVKALGFEIRERNQVQISMNLVNYTGTPIYRVFETLKSEAERYGATITSSEIIGLVPNDALLACSEHYLRLEKFSKAQVLEEKLRGAFAKPAKTESFYDQVASSAPAPGGGSVAASAGALCAALTAMVCRLTVGKKQYADVRDELGSIRDKADELRLQLVQRIEDDAAAFHRVMDAFKLPKGTDAEIAARNSAVQSATIAAAEVPLTVMDLSCESLRLARIVADKGNQNSLSDAGVAGLMGWAAVQGAGYNVRINCRDLTDRDRANELIARADRCTSEARELAERIHDIVSARLS